MNIGISRRTSRDISVTHQTRWIIYSLMLIIVLLIVLLTQKLTVSAAPLLTVTPLTWNVIGLDSNNVLDGPNKFPVGVRVCNIGDLPAANITANFVWDNTNVNINLSSGSLNPISLISLAASQCSDIYFDVTITRTSVAYDTSRQYHIDVMSNGLTLLRTQVPREVYVEHLVSQNRNSVLDVQLDGESIPPGRVMNLMSGHTYTVTLIGDTATNGYEQIETFINFPNQFFRIRNIRTTYTADDGTDPLAETRFYADGCGWVNDPSNPDYRSCIGVGKYGGVVTLVYTIDVIGGAGTTQMLNTLIYDFSGSSYHYNNNFSSSTRYFEILDPPTPTVTLTSSPTNTMTATLSATSTSTETSTPSYTPTSTLTNTPTSTMTVTPSTTPTNTGTNIPNNTPINTMTLTPSNTPTTIASPTPTNTVTITPSSTPTRMATSDPPNPPTRTSTPSDPGYFIPITGFMPDTGFAPNVVTALTNSNFTSYTETFISLEIPSLAINIEIVGIPFRNREWNVSWLTNQAGWLEGSAFPSWNGNSVLTSHVYLSSGKPGPFFNLSKLKYGDLVIVRAYGENYTFAVRTNDVVVPKDRSFIKHEEKPWLTLVTCKDYDEITNTYLNRTVVRALLITIATDK